MQDHPNDRLTQNDSNNIPVLNQETEDESSLAVEKENSQQIETEQDQSTIENGDIQKEESRTRIVFRKFIRWTFGLLIVFGLGYLTAIFTIYTPKVDELDQSGKNLDNAQSTIIELESEINAQQNEIDRLDGQINDLKTEISNLETENQAFVEEQIGFHLQIALLKTRSDVISAQVELYQENPAQARLLLDSASQNLAMIESLLPDDLKDVVSPLQNRLELAVGEIEDDPETAIADLAILAGDLLEIENALFNE
jgi:septal ring factor EnvC (AmiA/AmiB activator)